MLNYLAHGSGGIPSPAAFEQFGADYAANPVGTGPYKLDSFTPGTELTLVPNETFWGDPAKLEKITFRATPEVSSRVLSLDAGEADLGNDLPQEEVDRF